MAADEVSVVSAMSAALLSAAGFATVTDGNGPAAAADITCRNNHHDSTAAQLASCCNQEVQKIEWGN